MAINLNDQLKNLQQRKELLVILLFLFVIVILWIAIDVFSSQQRSGISAQQKKIAQPLSPNLDTAVLDKLNQKTIYTAEELADFPIFIVEDDQGQQVLIDARTGSSADGEVALPEDLEGALEEIEADL
jgi:ABC-type Na+ efflux pump permease subunit